MEAESYVIETEAVWDLLKNELQRPKSGNNFVRAATRGRVHALAEVIALAYPAYKRVTPEQVIAHAKEELGIKEDA